jgi:N-acetylglutamate synthase-like GNAT family acetyltransferase
MNPMDYGVRRATIDDLPGLIALWDSMHIAAADLEKRLTEFQIAESADGALLGTIGIAINGRHGLVHNEAFKDFALADVLRESFLERIQSIAKNHGLARLWTREAAPFWKRSGFQPATTDVLQRLPEVWSTPGTEWTTLQLRDEQTLEVSLDKEFAMFMQSEKQHTRGMFQQARVMKYVATVLAIVLAIMVLVIAVYAFKNRYALRDH